MTTLNSSSHYPYFFLPLVSDYAKASSDYQWWYHRQQRSFAGSRAAFSCRGNWDAHYPMAIFCTAHMQNTLFVFFTKLRFSATCFDILFITINIVVALLIAKGRQLDFSRSLGMMHKMTFMVLIALCTEAQGRNPRRVLHSAMVSIFLLPPLHGRRRFYFSWNCLATRMRESFMKPTVLQL